MNETIFFVEDDVAIQALLKEVFELHGYNAEGFLNGADFFKRLKTACPDLIIMDLMLPGMSGSEIIKKLKSDDNYSHIPIIILSALGDEQTVVNNIDRGAIDFIIKPFRVNEFISRVRSALRNSAPKREEPQILTVGEITLDRSKVICTVNGQQVPMTPKEFKLLYLLMKQKGKVVHRTELLRLIWGFHVEVETRTVDMHIKSLREKLSKVTDKQYISTVRSIGYILSCEE